MTNDSRVPAGVPTGGQFTATVPSEGVVSLAEDHLAVGWSPEPNLVRVTPAATGNGWNYDVALQPGGHVVFDLSGSTGRAAFPDPGEVIDDLELRRNEEGTFTVTASIRDLDYGHLLVADPSEQEWDGNDLDQHQDAIDRYLLDEYGALDAGSEWDMSALELTVDITSHTAATGSDTINTDTSLQLLEYGTPIGHLREDLKAGVFWSKLRAHLGLPEPRLVDDSE